MDDVYLKLGIQYGNAGTCKGRGAPRGLAYLLESAGV